MANEIPATGYGRKYSLFALLTLILVSLQWVCLMFLPAPWGLASMQGNNVHYWTVVPFVTGLVLGLLFPLRNTSRWPRVAIVLQVATLILMALSAVIVILVGLEGMICIVMAVPLVWVPAALGAFIASFFRRFSPYMALNIIVALVALASLLVLPGMSPASAGESIVQPVVTVIDIAAPPETVWKHVVQFDELPPATEWYFRAGIAHPLRARIEGTGVGAIRYCEFSTGPFVEPITVWDEPHRLAFDVTENPAPLQELSPYEHLHTAHIEGYMISKRGEFLLTPLSGGGTRLQGTTWYQHGLLPETYWRWWSDAIIHRIHLRVLNHIKVLAEEDA